jgi:hypothetical protein
MRESDLGLIYIKLDPHLVQLSRLKDSAGAA